MRTMELLLGDRFAMSLHRNKNQDFMSFIESSYSTVCPELLSCCLSGYAITGLVFDFA